ncbi:MAG: HPr family phosphocarrier protein [Clostridia bacterium]|nr:HPr family phosphocarrier protein [Clostridia bacterium]
MVTKQLSFQQMANLDLHMAAELVNVASRYLSTVYVRYDRGRVHLGSLIGVLAIPTLKGERYVLEVNGEDEERALKAILRALGA